MMMNDTVFDTPRPKPGAALRVFCFPFAGGSSVTYHPWLDHLHPLAELVTVQMPARGARLAADPCDNMPELVASLFGAIGPLLNQPFVFFGHSMGAKVAFELAKRLHEAGLPLPQHFVASASPAPFFPRAGAPVHDLSDAQFIAHLADLNGTPERVLRSRELMALLMPAMRADFKLLHAYVGSSDTVLPTRLTLCGGHADDSVPQEQLLAWRRLFTQPGALHMFDGGHFFINQHTAGVMDVVNGLVDDVLAPAGAPLPADALP
jgi:medium-chain acyl-[acyl-carrier-protein] hydrolase